MRRVRWTVILTLLGACGHDAPFSWSGPEPQGPIDTTVPRRLTFNPGDDRNPSAMGGTLVFSRVALDVRKNGRERCLAFLPATGGTLRRTICPPLPLTPADTFIDTWVEPALSPDERHVAFAWQRGAPASYYTWTRDLVVAPVDDPGHPTFTWPVWYVLPDSRVATTISKTIWLSATKLRFLASYERVFKVKGGGADRLTDTVIDVFSLVDLDMATGHVGVVPGADSTIAYAIAPGATNDYWLVKSSDSTRLLRLASGAETVVPVANFSGPIVDLANVDGVPVGLHAGGLTLEWVDLPTGLRGFHNSFTVISRIVAVPGTRYFVAEVEKTDVPLAPDGANLWLFAVP